MRPTSCHQDAGGWPTLWCVTEIVVQCIGTGRPLGGCDDDRWLIDRASVDEKLKRLSRASW